MQEPIYLSTLNYFQRYLINVLYVSNIYTFTRLICIDHIPFYTDCGILLEKMYYSDMMDGYTGYTMAYGGSALVNR